MGDRTAEASALEHLGFGLPEATRSRRDLAQPQMEGGRIAQTCFARRGGLAPINFPLLQGSRPALGGMTSMKSRIVMLLCCRGTSGCASWLIKLNLKVSFQERCGRGRPSVGISISQADPCRTCTATGVVLPFYAAQRLWRINP